MAINFDQANSYIYQLIVPKLYSSFVQVKPLLWALAGNAVTGMDKLGDPQANVVFGGAGLGLGTMTEYVGSYQRQVRFQATAADAAVAVAQGGQTPVASQKSDTLVKQFATRWCDFWTEMQADKDRCDGATGKEQVASIMEEAVAMHFNPLLQKIQTELWTGTLDETGQDAELWSTFLGLQHTCDGSGTDFYGGKDRSLYPALQGKEVAAATLTTASILTTDHVSLKLIRYLKTVNAYGGVCNRYANAGTLAITTPDLWNTMANDAETKHTLFDAGATIPNRLNGVSTKFPVIMKDTTAITYDPDCPAGELYLLTPDFWVFEVQKGNNFKVHPWQPKWLNDEGGAKYYFAPINAKCRLTNYRPDLNVKVTGLAA